MGKLRFRKIKSLAQDHSAIKQTLPLQWVYTTTSQFTAWGLGFFIHQIKYQKYPIVLEIYTFVPVLGGVPHYYYYFFIETRCRIVERNLRAVACSQTHCSQAIMLKTGHVWRSAPVSFQAGLCGQLGSLSLGSKLFSSGSDFQDRKDTFDTDQVQL